MTMLTGLRGVETVLPVQGQVLVQTCFAKDKDNTLRCITPNERTVL